MCTGKREFFLMIRFSNSKTFIYGHKRHFKSLTSMEGKIRQITKNEDSKHIHEEHMCLSKKMKILYLK